MPEEITYYAHTTSGPQETWQRLEEHLTNVAQLAGEFASTFQSHEWGRLAGLWHDLGKFEPDFQARLTGEKIAVEHSGFGAAYAAAIDRESGLFLAFIIAGHHTGLANLLESGPNYPTPLRDRIKRNESRLRELLKNIPHSIHRHDVPQLQPPVSEEQHNNVHSYRRRLEFWTRFLFSALVDADRLDTEAFCTPAKSLLRGRYPALTELCSRCDAYLDQKMHALPVKIQNSPMNNARSQILDACKTAAVRPPGFFSLTVPTGGGKTLSAMAFALHHAKSNDRRRVIVVIPYTSIIEQNAAVYRDALGHENVIEHHSNLDFDQIVEESGEEFVQRHAYASENWDAPIIVTTTVQFFESLFSNRPSQCRKLHNIARSVIILDEVQSLPAGFLITILDGLKELVSNYGCTIVFATATPPALGARENFAHGISGIVPIVSDAAKLADQLRRVRYSWPKHDTYPVEWNDLASQLAGHRQVLSIVHRRHDARTLGQILRDELALEGVFHLSALMCPRHRSQVLQVVRTRLNQREVCRLVSTQLIEAGVDVDFPVVYRALAGLDSIVQAAGRCNREGHLEYGDVVVFRAPSNPPRGILLHGLEKMTSLLNEYGDFLDPSDPALCEIYFRRLYHGESLDKHGIQTDREAFNFASVAGKFRLIEDGFTKTIAVPYEDGSERLDRLRSELQVVGRGSPETFRALQPFLVQVYPDSFKRMDDAGAIEAITPGLYALTRPFMHLYDREYGLVVGDEIQANAASMII